MDYLLQIFQFLENGSYKLVGSGTKWRSEHLVEKVCYFLGWKFECTAISLLEDKQRYKFEVMMTSHHMMFFSM